MVQVTDGIGRPIYLLDSDGRYHPYTKEKVDDNFEYEHPKCDGGVILALIIFSIVIIGGVLSMLLFTI